MRDILGLSPRYDMQVTLLERVKSCEKVSLAVSKLQEGKQSYFEELQLRLALWVSKERWSCDLPWQLLLRIEAWASGGANRSPALSLKELSWARRWLSKVLGVPTLLLPKAWDT